MRRTILILLLLLAAAALTWLVVDRLAEAAPSRGPAAGTRAPVPVEIAAVTRGSIALRRTFSGTLEAAARFVVAPKVGGRLKSVDVDLGDVVERGQVVATIDDDEFVQAVQRAAADLAVAKASLAEATAALEIASRALKRAESMRDEGVTSETLLDTAIAKELASRSRVEVGKSNVVRAESDLESARIRLGYTRVVADWTDGDDSRVVAERYVDGGGVVSANARLLSIVELDPIVAVVEVPERDYARLAAGQKASLTTDSHPGRVFVGSISRIAPVFRRSTRQARVELLIENEDEMLKPGMFVRATLELLRVDDTIAVPFEALIERDGSTGLFVLDSDQTHSIWKPVVVGVREGERVQIVSGLDEATDATQVVTLGQALCDDGAPIVVAGTYIPKTSNKAKGSG